MVPILRKFLSNPICCNDQPGSIENLFTESRRESWNLSETDVKSAISRMKEDRVSVKQAQDRRLLFPYAKALLEKETSAYRKKEFNAILHPERFTGQERAKYQGRLDRLETIVISQEKLGTFGVDAENLFEKFVSEHTEWGPTSSYVVFRDHPSLKDKLHTLVQRIQKSGLCYAHAAIVMQHYLVAMTNDTAVPMLDLAEYLKRYTSATRLKKHIWDNAGGFAPIFLREILVQKPEPIVITCGGTSDIKGFMEKYGPALVSGFRVENSFMQKEVWFHHGERSFVEVGHHAMVLVGARTDNGKPRYLLQNWWREKPFIEVDAEYLFACNATISFVVTPQYNMGKFPTNNSDQAECEDGLDAQETFIMEGPC